MRNTHIQYRIDRANETYLDAIRLFEFDSLNSCVNRLYYSAFYMVIALLLNHDIEIKSHKGVKIQFGKYILNQNELSKDHAKLYSILNDYRHKGDYDDLYEFDKDLVQDLMVRTQLLIQSIEKLINLNK